jgi:hypothetical protein
VVHALLDDRADLRTGFRGDRRESVRRRLGGP